MRRQRKDTGACGSTELSASKNAHFSVYAALMFRVDEFTTEPELAAVALFCG